MEARLPQFYKRFVGWKLLIDFDEAIPVSNSHVTAKPASVLSIGEYPQDVFLALQSAMREPGSRGWTVHEIGNQHRTHLSDGAMVDAINVLIVKEKVTLKAKGEPSKMPSVQ
ncbi:MAG: hypothetical protein Q9199_005781 [Rusavskia elegans]